MTYGTGHLLIGGWGYFQGKHQEKILLCRWGGGGGGGGGNRYMKNKNILQGMCFANST